MQPGFAVSTGVHAALLAISILGLTAARPLDAGLTESVPIELVTPSEFDALTKGAKTSKVVDKPPQIKATKVAEADPEEKVEDVKEAKQDVKAPPPPPPPTPQPKVAEQTPPPPPKPAEQKPEPPKPPEAKPQPPQQVSEDALKQKPADKQQQDQQKPEPPKPEQQKAEQKPEPPKPQQKPTPPQKTAEQKPPPKPQPTFNADKIAALLDKRQPVRTASASREMTDTTTAGIPRGTAAKLSLSQRTAIEGMMREQISPCWNPPIGAAGAEDMKVTVRFQLNSDGSLDGEPSVVQWQSSPGFQAAADSALRAVRRCSPLHLPAEAYDYWRDVQINFDPKDMLGG